jgi:hypothetical protein
MLETSAMVVNQALQVVLTRLNASPALAANLTRPEGLHFDHISFNKGRVQMFIDGDLVTVKMMLGSFVRFFQNREEILQYEPNLRHPPVRKYLPERLR